MILLDESYIDKLIKNFLENIYFKINIFGK